MKGETVPGMQLLDAVVLGRESVADGVVRITLGTPDRRALPEWEPGAHIDVHLGSLIRQYSLCSSPQKRDHYQIAVLREPFSRGGSSHVHDRLAVGDPLQISPPRNHFAQVDAAKYVFIAGGIGITPMIPMIEAAERKGADWRLVYGGRTAASMAFVDDLMQYGARVELFPEDTCGRINLHAVLSQPVPETSVYCCGPEGLLRSVESLCALWPAGSLHTERFSPIPDTGNLHSNTAFEVQFAKSGVILTVPPERSILEVAEEAGVPVVYSCEEGTCGSCETPLLAGLPDHRDSVLTDEQRRACSSMMICVSRARSPQLVLDA
ncbi:PDR/VanB family oxidoreductase [Mycolicibacterium goodii]|nr:PDR/VanB family oxidoreductase [Mycolicibacterium goodii]